MFNFTSHLYFSFQVFISFFLKDNIQFFAKIYNLVFFISFFFKYIKHSSLKFFIWKLSDLNLLEDVSIICSLFWLFKSFCLVSSNAWLVLVEWQTLYMKNYGRGGLCPQFLNFCLETSYAHFCQVVWGTRSFLSP